eukprot:44985-Pyramimonas_sp.AAC.1
MRDPRDHERPLPSQLPRNEKVRAKVRQRPGGLELVPDALGHQLIRYKLPGGAFKYQYVGCGDLGSRTGVCKVPCSGLPKVARLAHPSHQ